MTQANFSAASGEWNWENRPSRLSVIIATELTARIVRGDQSAGTFLPAETALCEEFRVSRTVLREALKMLEKNRLITIRQGDGTSVNPTEDWNLLDPQVLALVIHFAGENNAVRTEARELRQDLETRMTKAATSKLDPAAFDEMSALLDVMDHDESSVVLQRADAAFHDVIMRASGNRIARTLVTLLFSEPAVTSDAGWSPTRSDYDLANAQHRQIASLLQEGKADEAAQAMADHIAHGHWLQSTP